MVEHIELFEESFREVSRVVKDGGRFVLAMNHPLLQSPGSSWVEDWTTDPLKNIGRLVLICVKRAAKNISLMV